VSQQSAASQPAITMYVSDWCPYCRRAKDLLAGKSLAVARSSRRTVPQIFIGEKHVGGCDDLFALEESGELDRIIRGAG
jgi:glutaredoxin 3